MTARFSVFIPVRNGARWLPGSIESVLGQLHPDWELIIGDNASSDGTEDVVARYVDDPRIRYHRWEAPAAIFENWNRTEALSRFEWVQALSADDRLHPRCLQAMAERIEASRGRDRRLVMVLTGTRRVRPDGTPVDVRYYGYRGVASIPDGVHDAAAWLKYVCSPGSPPWNFGSVAIAREVIAEMGMFYRTDNPSMSADLELALRVGAYGDVAYIDEPLLDVVWWPGSDTPGRTGKNRAEDEPLTTLGAALLSGLEAHERRRTVSPAERAAVYAAVARSHLQRAAGHRYLSGGRGRRAALVDVLRAVRYSPRTALTPAQLAYASAAVLAPRRALQRLRDLILARRERRRSGSPWRRTNGTATPR